MHAGGCGGIGVVVPADSPDPVADARRAENLGFDHIAMPGSSRVRVLLALGGTRTLRLLVDEAALGDDLGPLAMGYRERLVAWPEPRTTLRLDLSDVGAAYETIRRCLDPGRPLIIELHGGPHARLVRTLALDVLPASLAGRARPVLYAEDLAVGDSFELGEFEITEDDIVAFGERWDPLDFHVDAELAAGSALGVLCASGLHTQAVMQRLAARGLHRNIAIVAGRGMLGMRLWAPVTPGMRLRGRTEVAEVEDRPNGRAVVTVRSTLSAGEQPILEQTGQIVVRQRTGRLSAGSFPAGAHKAPDE